MRLTNSPDSFSFFSQISSLKVLCFVCIRIEFFNSQVICRESKATRKQINIQDKESDTAVEVANGFVRFMSSPNVKSQRSRRRRKQKKSKDVSPNNSTEDANGSTDNDRAKANSDPNMPLEQVEVEYVPETAELDGDLGEEFRKIFEKFNWKEAAVSGENEQNHETAQDAAVSKKKMDSDGEEEEEEEENPRQKEKGLSNKKKLQQRMTIAELKLMSARPDVVEVWDVTAPDPVLLVHLKSCRNTVPVPRHWCQKRKYLQGKCGIEKPPFQLPEAIAKTGIMEQRQAYVEKEEGKKAKQKQRDRMQPKSQMNIDYQILHDAFFKNPTKPKLTKHGDLYYEGKEFEVKMREMKPGVLSKELKQALGMPEGAPPPWLLNMQRYGPPPSYPGLKIPGLNAPIPPGARFGYQPGGWGKPPVDESGRPLYGDVFGVFQQEQPDYEDEPIDKGKHWDDYEEEEVEVEEEEEEEEVQIKEEKMEDDIQSVDSISNTSMDFDIPDVIDLRKEQWKDPGVDIREVNDYRNQQRKEPERPLYQVLPEQESKIAPGTILGTTHTYMVPGTQDTTSALKSKKTDKVDVTLAPEELEETDNVLEAKYEQAMEEEKLRNKPEDFSDMVAENAKKRKRKMQEKEGKSKKKKKKTDFKF